MELVSSKEVEWLVLFLCHVCRLIVLHYKIESILVSIFLRFFYSYLLPSFIVTDFC